jgi:hypothetical protein
MQTKHLAMLGLLVVVAASSTGCMFWGNGNGGTSGTSTDQTSGSAGANGQATPGFEPVLALAALAAPALLLAARRR